MTATEQVDQVDEEAAMVRRYVTPGDPQRTDKPQVSEALAAVLAAQAQLAEQHAALKERERDLRVELLPDDERARLGQIWREMRDGTLDLEPEIPVTRCPEWCEVPDHAESREGKWHAGAISAVKVNDSHTLSCEVVHGSDGITDMDMSLDIWGEGSGVPIEQAREHAAGILRAADLLERLLA